MTDETTTIEQPRVAAEQPAAANSLMAAADHVALSATGGIDYNSLKDLYTLAGWLCKAGPMLPPWLQNNHGGMFAICMRAQEVGISPLTLANWSYIVENKGVARVSYESQYFHALIEARAPLKERLRYEIIGEGDDRRCKVWATLKGEIEPRVFLSDTLGKLRPGKNQYGATKGSPLWDSKPELQMFYNASRDFARVYFPDVLGGVYGKDEMDDDREAHQGPQNARDVSPGIASRLSGPSEHGTGFAGISTVRDIEASIDAARAKPAEPEPEPDSGTKVLPSRRRTKNTAASADAPQASDDPVGSASGSSAASESEGRSDAAIAETPADEAKTEASN